MTRSNPSIFLSFFPLLLACLSPSLIRGAVVTLYDVVPTDALAEPTPTDLAAEIATITAAGVGSDGTTTYLVSGGADASAYTITLLEGSQRLNDGVQSCSFSGNGGLPVCVVDLGGFVISTGDGGAPISTEVFTTYTGALTPFATLVDGGAVITQGGSSAGGSSSATDSGASTPSASVGGGSSAGGSSSATNSGASAPSASAGASAGGSHGSAGGSSSAGAAPPQSSGGGGNSTSTNTAARDLDAKGHYEWLMASSLVGIISGIWLV